MLSTESELPRPYQIGVFPTYWIVDADGEVASVAEGDQGFSELRKMLKKAGMDVDWLNHFPDSRQRLQDALRWNSKAHLL